MAFTPDAPPAGHFTPDAPPAAPPAYQPDKTDIANQLASHPELPGVGDFVDILRNIPPHLVRPDWRRSIADEPLSYCEVFRARSNGHHLGSRHETQQRDAPTGCPYL